MKKTVFFVFLCMIFIQIPCNAASGEMENESDFKYNKTTAVLYSLGKIIESDSLLFNNKNDLYNNYECSNPRFDVFLNNAGDKLVMISFFHKSKKEYFASGVLRINKDGVLEIVSGGFGFGTVEKQIPRIKNQTANMP